MKPARTPDCEHGNRHTKESNGGVHVTASNMRLPTGVLCVECPLRRDSAPGYLGGYTPEMYLEIMESGASIACHMSPGFQERDISRQNHCTGVAAYRANVGILCMHDGIITRAHDATRFVATIPGVFKRVFASAREFLAHHKPGQPR